jgi:phosphoglycerate dehydrogenase-like enzyme
MPDDTILVLRQGVHGMPVDDYATAIRERLPEYDVEMATSRREEKERISRAQIATDRAIDDELLDHADSLRLFAGLSAGYDHIPLSRLAEAGVAVTNASGVHGPNIAEQAIGWVLTFSRRLHEGWRRQQNREWRHFQAGELQGSTVTVVGLGAIGRAVAERLDGFGVDTVGVRYTPSKRGPTDEVVGMESPDFEPALAETDYLILACPLTEATEGLISTEELTTLPTNAVLVNVGRGGVVETEALTTALRGGGGIRGAALDVTDPEPLPEDHELWTLENVLITPHMAGHTPKYYERRADTLARNVRTIAETGQYTDLENQVASPE